MKKLILVILALLALIAGGGYWYFRSLPGTKATTLALESVLPKETYGIIKVFDAKKQVERFKAGRMGQSLAAMDLPALLNLLEIPRQEQKRILEMVSGFRSAADSPWFDILFGREFALVLLPLSAEEKIDADQLAQACLLVARPKQPTKVLESLNSMFAKPLDIRTSTFRQWTISEFALENGRPVYYALTDGLLLVAPSILQIQRCLEQSLDADSSLRNRARYRSFLAELHRSGQTDSFFYADLEQILEKTKKTLTAMAPETPEAASLRGRLAEMNGLETVAGAAYDDGSALTRARIIVQVDRGRLSETLRTVFAEDSGRIPPLRQVPGEILLYSWQNNFGVDAYWRNLAGDPATPPEAIKKIKKGFHDATGVGLETFLAALDSQFSFLLSDIRFGQLFPVPQMALSLGVKDAAVVRKAIHGAAQRTGLPLRKETYLGVEVVFTPLGEDLAPAYACDDSVCTIAVTNKLLRSILSAPENGNLAAASGFKAVDHGLSAENSQISYMDMEGILAKTRAGLSWSESRMALIQPDKGEKFRRIVDAGIHPLLEGLSGIKAIGSRTYVEKNRMISDLYVAMERNF